MCLDRTLMLYGPSLFPTLILNRVLRFYNVRYNAPYREDQLSVCLI